MDDHHHNKRKNVHEINLGFSKETMMMTSLFDSSIGMSSSSSASIQDYNSTFHDLEMLIHNNRDEYHFDSVDPFIDNIPPEYNSEVQVNTPNSCSISSSSTEAAAGTDDRKKIDDDDEDQDQEKAKKQLLKPKKKKQKKEREARFAFMTKSDVDHLDDGFRWRKYGQKAVKNSPFPRSYYRCTSTLCGVKKRVERCNEDPSTVVTTYEGTHTHPCPVMPRGTFGIIPEITRQMLPYQQQQQQPYFHHNLTSPRLSFDEKDVFSPPMVRERPFCPSASTASARDHGLLQDMLPSKMLKETKE